MERFYIAVLLFVITSRKHSNYKIDGVLRIESNEASESIA
jgi:hypothetical protein